MTKKLFILLVLFSFCHVSTQAGQEVVAVQSIRVKPYEKAFQGFQSLFDSKIRRFVVSELKGENIVGKIQAIQPDMILAIGMNALLQVKKIKNIPVVYIMVLNPHAILSGKQNMTGIRMNVSPARQTALLLKVLPDVKSIGLLYDPSQTAYLVKEVRDAAAKAGVELIAEEVRRSREVPSRIIDMKGRIDLFWMLPDTTVVTPETVEFLFLFFLDNRIPVFSFSKKYVESGALMSIDIDVFDMGRQAGELVKAIQAGKGIDHNAHSVEANKVRLSINPEIARNLGIHIDQDIIEQAHIVGKGK